MVMSDTHLTPQEVVDHFKANSPLDDIWVDKPARWPSYEHDDYFENTLIVHYEDGTFNSGIEIGIDLFVYNDRIENKTIIQLHIPFDDLKEEVARQYHTEIYEILNERIECTVDTNKGAIFDKLKEDYQHPVVTKTIEITDRLRNLLQMGMHYND